MTEHLRRIEVSGFAAYIADNEAVGIHRAGYNGVASLVPPTTGNNIFVPSYCGLNYECTWIEGLEQSEAEMFEPRRAPMSIIDADRTSVLLHQPPTAAKGIEAFITFRAEEPHYLHQHVRIVFHDRRTEGRRFTSLWASYMHAPPDRHVYMQRGGEGLSGWVGITKQRHRAPYYIVHDLPPRELSAQEHVELAADPPEPPRSESLGGPLDFYYGVYFDHALIMMFARSEGVGLAYSPNGGDELPPWNPAWDYVLAADKIVLGEPYEWDLCAAVKPFAGRLDVLEEAARYR